MLRTALALAEKGMRVFPCAVRAKEPATPRGCKDATADPHMIRHWWGLEPQYNLAVATGAVSGIIAIDIDGPDAEAELRKLELEHGALPATVEVITARGRHLYFKAPKLPVRNSTGKIGPGIDVRGDGGYVLSPPSVHPTGKTYRWSVDSANALAPPPAWLLDKIATPANGATTATPVSDWRVLVRDGVGHGARDCTVARLTGYLLRRRIDPMVVLGLMQSWNATSCTPALPTADIDRIVDSIASRELARRGGSHGE
jgi:hypothetical protein